MRRAREGVRRHQHPGVGVRSRDRRAPRRRCVHLRRGDRALLGCVTAACLAAAGHEVTGSTQNVEVTRDLQGGHAPLFEPGLDDLIQKDIAKGTLRFTSDPAEALRGAEVVWVTYDTPVDDDDNADVDFVLDPSRRSIRSSAMARSS